jgi:Zn-dependent peptidase ImmA (M78 family)
MTKDEYEDIMYLKKQRLINEYADNIRCIFNIQIPITNIEEVVGKIGGIVKYDGKCSYIEKSKQAFTIHVENNKDYKIKNFKVAQQLGKLFLYTNFILEHELFKKDNTITFKDSLYQEGSTNWINEFALALLMPRNKYIEEVDKNTNGNLVNTEAVAEYFDVSISTASWRGKRLGVLKD